MARSTSVFSRALTLAAVVAVPVWATPEYGVVDLGPGYAYGMNDAGDVAGKSYNPDLYGPAVWPSGFPVPTLLPAHWSGTAMDINNAGVVVGQDGDCPFGYRTPCGVQWFPPYSPANKIYLRGLAENSGVFAPAGIQAVNNGGFVVGHSFSAVNPATGNFNEMHATCWDPSGVPTDLGVLSGDESLGFGINDAVKVVGDSGGRVYYWGGSGNVIVAKDVFPQMYGNTAYDINNAMQFVGSYATAGGYVAYRYDSLSLSLTTIGHLGAEGATGYAINDAGEVVGTSALTAYFGAFVWNAWDGILRLDQLIHPDDPLLGLVSLIVARDINEFGWILAEGGRSDDPGVNHVFLLMPLELSAAYLTTGSPVSISQEVNTLDTPFEFSFDYRFGTPTGVLSVRLDGADLVTVPAAVSPILQTETMLIDAPHLNQSSVVLEFELEGPADSSVALDNIIFPGLINGRFASGDFYSWTTSVPVGGTAGVVDLPMATPFIFGDGFESTNP